GKWRFKSSLPDLAVAEDVRRSRFLAAPGMTITSWSRSNYRGPISHGKLWITFDDFGIQLRRLALTPHGCSEPDPIIQGAAVGLIVSIDGALDADKFSLQIVIADADHCIPVPSCIDKRQMGGILRIGLFSGLVDVAGLDVFQAGPHAMPQKHVDHRLRSLVLGPLSNEKVAKPFVLREAI